MKSPRKRCCGRGSDGLMPLIATIALYTDVGDVGRGKLRMCYLGALGDSHRFLSSSAGRRVRILQKKQEHPSVAMVDNRVASTVHTRYRHTLGTPNMWACNVVRSVTCSSCYGQHWPGALRQMFLLRGKLIFSLSECVNFVCHVAAKKSPRNIVLYFWLECEYLQCYHTASAFCNVRSCAYRAVLGFIRRLGPYATCAYTVIIPIH